MEIQDDTEVLRQYFGKLDPDSGEIESVHRAELSAESAMPLMNDPKGALKAMGIQVSDESVVNVTMKNRADRAPVTLAARTALVRRVIVIIIHYRNCDADIIIIATR